jgi:hypothetical protein
MKELKDPRVMLAHEINKELESLRKLRAKLTDKYIAAGRGHERPSDRVGKTDPLSLEAEALEARRSALYIEAELRYGPGFHGTLPRGAGPRKTY